MFPDESVETSRFLDPPHNAPFSSAWGMTTLVEIISGLVFKNQSTATRLWLHDFPVASCPVGHLNTATKKRKHCSGLFISFLS